MPITARALSTPQWTHLINHNTTTFYGSSCANNGKGALNTCDDNIYYEVEQHRALLIIGAEVVVDSFI